jgi:hypothetical protein
MIEISSNRSDAITAQHVISAISELYFQELKTGSDILNRQACHFSLIVVFDLEVSHFTFMNSHSSAVPSLSSLHKSKAKWSSDEDHILLGLVQEHGAHRWNELAESIPGRTGKQCRERWLSKLSPEFTSTSWSPEEDRVLIHCQETYGNQWAKFRGQLPSRSLVQIKNRWVSLTRRGYIPTSPQIALPLRECQLPAPRELSVCLGEPAVSEYDFGNAFDLAAFDDGFADQSLWTF